MRTWIRLAIPSSTANWLKPDSNTKLGERLSAIVESLRVHALHDIRGEGFGAQEIVFGLELIVDTAQGKTRLVRSPLLELESEDDLRRVCDVCAPGADEVVFDSLLLRARGAVPHSEMRTWTTGPEEPSAALKTERPVYWRGGFRDTRVYEYSRLHPGNVVRGPAVIDSDSTTYVLPKGARLTVDRHRNGIIEMTGIEDALRGDAP